MQEETGGMAMVARQQAASIAFQQAAGMKVPRFHVELKAGETTFVSWRKLVKEHLRAAAPPSGDPPLGAHPALEARIAPEIVAQKVPLPPPQNRFNSVIEKIERIYKGDDSTDENDALNDVPDDDQYDTEDSFIDDRELNEYFSVDKAKLKHEGFFVNRGKLEWEAETAAAAEAAPKKRNRRDVKKLNMESKPVNGAKGTAKKAASTAIGSSFSPDKDLSAFSAPIKQGGQKRRKEGQPFVPQNVAGKAAEKGVYEHEHLTTDSSALVIAHTANESTRERLDPGHVFKGDGGEMADMQLSAIKMGKLNSEGKRQRDGAVSSIVKINAAQHSSSLEISRAIAGGGGQKHRSSMHSGKDVSPLRPKGTAWERAFQDLEKAVGQSCPPSVVLQEPEQGKRSRLPQDVKQKLAKVARLAGKQGRLTDEVIERLMGILGHVVRATTLKRNLKDMIEMGLSAMQEKEGRVQDMKREVTEMVKLRVYSLQAQDLEEHEPLSDDFQPVVGSAEKPIVEGRYHWDHATEDKVCDLYEQYIEGLEENKGPQIRKLYGQLAELWPDGWMDNNGIKHAVQRAKDRKKNLSKAIIESETKKRQRPSSKRTEVETVRFPLLDLNVPGTEQLTYEKGKNAPACQHDLKLASDRLMPLFEEERADQPVRKSVGKTVDSENKKTKLGGTALPKKVKQKLEKGTADVVGSEGELMEGRLWRTSVQPSCLPARSN